MNIGIKQKCILFTLSILLVSNILLGIMNYNISKNELEENGKRMLRNSVNMAIELASTLNDEVEKGNISLEEAQEKVKFALLGELNIDGTRPINENIDLGELGYAFIYNVKGLLVAHPNIEGENLWDTVTEEGFHFARDQITKAQDGGGFTVYDWKFPFEEEKEGLKITYSAYYPEWSWIFVAGSYMQDFNQGARNILTNLIFSLVISSITGILLVYFISSRIASGIIKTANYSDQLANGRLDIPDIINNSHDEVAILTNSINNMKRNLLESYEEIEAYNEEVRGMNEELELTNQHLIKSNNRYESLYNNMSSGFAYHQCVFDDDGNPVDYMFLEVNKAFEELTGLKKKNILNKPVTEVLPDLQKSDFNWIQEYGQVAISGESIKFTQFSEPLERWYQVNVFSFEEGYFATVFSDISDLVAYQEELKRQKTELLESYERLEADHEEFIALNEELESSYNELNRANNNLEQMIHLSSKLNLTNICNETFLKEIFETSFKLVNEAEFALLFSYKNNKIKVINSIDVDINENSEILCTKSVNQIDIDIYNKDKGNFFKEISNFNYRINDIKETIVINLSGQGKDNIGIAFCISSKDNKFSINSYKILEAFRELASAFYKLQEYNIFQNKMRTDILIAVVRMLALHDQYTKDHSESVARLAREIARAMNMEENLIEKIYLTGLVHDIGKVLITVEVLNKKGKLTDDEYVLIKNHTIWGYETLCQFEDLKDIADYILSHHERWDGKGYPNGIAGNKIPIASQIIALADAWDAMTSDRPYRKALSHDQAVVEIIDGKGKQFSPAVVEVFLTIKEELYN
ncbi:HD domain-containing phosphohydrolase [Natronospora cellulosivora (SeqCode)]